MREFIVLIYIPFFFWFDRRIRAKGIRIDELTKTNNDYKVYIAENYVSKEFFRDEMNKIEAHLIRIEDKLDKRKVG